MCIPLDWNIAKSRNKEWRQPNIGKTSNDARIITLKSNPSRGTALPAPHGKGNKCELLFLYLSWIAVETPTDRHTVYREFFASGNFMRKWRLESVLNFHSVLFSLYQVLSMKRYIRVYFSLCLLSISGRSRTQRKLNTREKFSIYGISICNSCVIKVFGGFFVMSLCILFFVEW